MTSSLGSFYGKPVALRVLAERHDGDAYSREILLTLADSDLVVEYGIMTMDLSVVSEAVRSQVLDRTAPLGDILTRHDVLRTIEPKWFVRCSGHSPILTHFGPGVHEAFGRIGIIYCNHHPAIELLEVVVDGKDPS